MAELNYARAASQGKRSNTNIRTRPITETKHVGPDSNVEILQELFESKLTYDCIQNLEWYLIEPSRKTRNDSAKYQTNGASLLQVSSYC